MCYNGQSLPYGVQGAGNFYGQAQPGYYANSRSLKGSSPSLPGNYPLNPYFASQNPYYGKRQQTIVGLLFPIWSYLGYAAGQALEYTNPYAATAYPAQYYSSYGNYGTAASTAATYQLAQLPPCTTLANGAPTPDPSSLTQTDPSIKPEPKKCTR